MSAQNSIIVGVVLMVFMATGCKPEPKPITFGEEVCSYCTMTIVDTQHAAQVVTKKGKVYSFDAIECMLRSEQLKDREKVALFLCNDFAAPGEMIDATKATFLISEAVPSPMGANLSGFSSSVMAKKIAAEHPAEFLTWEELQNKF
jgi:copper chaperone NosL